MSVPHTILNQATQATTSGNSAIAIYENAIPPFVEDSLEQLYQNLYSSLVYLRVLGRADHLSTYVATENGQPVAIFLFRLEHGQARVFNNVILVRQRVVEQFARSLFARFKSIDIIQFDAVQTDVQTLPFPFQRFNTSENIVATLPATAEAYLASLGKNTRKNVRNYLNRVKRIFPSFEYALHEREAVSESQVRDILRLKNDRLAEMHVTSAIGSSETQKILRLVKARGQVGTIAIDGKICAGSIGYRIGSHSFGGVLAHDIAYDGYWIGMLCCYLTICECIARGCKEYHFLWGRNEYKYRMLGVRRDLDNLIIYRSKRQLLINVATACGAAAAGCSRKCRLWLYSAKTGGARLAKRLTR